MAFLGPSAHHYSTRLLPIVRRDMASTKLARLLFAQGGYCFFCGEPLARTSASIEHLVATSNGGRNDDENCVACCAVLNRLLGSMSLKEKIQVVLNQQGKFKCPSNVGSAKKVAHNGKLPAKSKKAATIDTALQDLQRRGAARPRSVKTLKRTLHALFNKELTEKQLGELIVQLEATGLVQITEQTVGYAFRHGGT